MSISTYYSNARRRNILETTHAKPGSVCYVTFCAFPAKWPGRLIAGCNYGDYYFIKYLRASDDLAARVYRGIITRENIAALFPGLYTPIYLANGDVIFILVLPKCAI